MTSSESAHVFGEAQERANNVKSLSEYRKEETSQNASGYHTQYAGESAAPAQYQNDFGVGMSDVSEEIKDKVAGAEARTDAKIAHIDGQLKTLEAKIEGKLDLVLSKLDQASEDSRTIRANQWVIGFGLAVLIVGVVALFPAFFGIGTQVKDMVDHAIDSHGTTTGKK